MTYILTARTTCIVSHIFGCWRNRVIHKEAHQKESSGRIQQCTSLWKFDRYITTLLLEKQDNAGQSSKGANKHQAAIDIREATQRTENKISWPPRPSDLIESALNVLQELGSFSKTWLTGNKEWLDEDCHTRVQRLTKSFTWDLTFGVSRGKINPPKQILLPYAVKTQTNNVELIQMLNRCGHGITYSQLEEINTGLCLQKMASASEILLPNNI